MSKNTHVGDDHPIIFLRKLAESLPSDTSFIFEAYKRINKTYGSFHVGHLAGDLTVDELSDSTDELKTYVNEMIASTKNSLGNEYEFGIRTKALGFGPQINIPCIDLTGRPSREKILDVLNDVTGLLGSQTFWIYDSGRSFHIYTETAISPMKNKRYMKLLKNHPSVVDTRWVDHSVAKGYGILRWSATSVYHATFPKLQEKIRLV